MTPPIYRKILVPIDGSTTSNLGLREALRFAKGHRSRLLLLHVLDEYYVFASGEPSPYIDEIIESMRRTGGRVVERAMALARRRGIKAQAATVESMTGGAAGPIVRQARKWGADLIVLGTHGRRGIRRAVMGSDAEQVVRNAPVPVLLVRAKTPRRGR